MKTHGASAAVAMLRDSVCTRGWQGGLQEQGRFAGAGGGGLRNVPSCSRPSAAAAPSAKMVLT